MAIEPKWGDSHYRTFSGLSEMQMITGRVLVQTGKMNSDRSGLDGIR